MRPVSVFRSVTAVGPITRSVPRTSTSLVTRTSSRKGQSPESTLWNRCVEGEPASATPAKTAASRHGDRRDPGRGKIAQHAEGSEAKSRCRPSRSGILRPVNAAPHRVRFASVLAALLALAASLGVEGSRAANPELTLNVNATGFLEIVLGNGTRIRTSSAPGATIPPGPYLVIVNTDVPEPQDSFHIFHLFGPGMNLSSDLLPCENPREVNTVTLRPSTTYSYEDTRHPELARVVFTTSGSGSSAETSGAGGGPSGTSYSGSVSNQSLVGSAVLRGTLTATVGPAGKLTLSRKGKNVTSLKTGRYRIAVDDKTATGGFTLQGANGKAVAVTAPSFVGRHTTTVRLKPGRWAFYTPAGKKHRFVVTA